MGEGGGSSDACRLRARGRQKHGVRTLPSRVSSILKGSFSKSVSTRQAGECGSPAGYWQGQVRHPSVACGDTSPCRGGFRGGSHTERLPCKGSWMRRKAQTEGCIAALRWNYLARSGRALPYVSQRAVLASSPQTLRQPAVPGFAARVPYIVGRAFTPAGEEVAAAGARWALCSALPRSARRFRKAPRRARSPALHCGRKRAAIRKRQPASTPDGGGGWRPGGCGGPEGYLQGQVRHPSVACGDTSPCRGGFRDGSHTERFPCKGSLSSSGLLKAASPVKGRRWRRLPYPSTVTSVRRTWPASQASRSRMQGAGRLPAVRSTRP